MEKENSKIVEKMPFSFRFGLTLIGCVGVYLIISLHFLLAVKTAHLLGDASYLPPSVYRYTGAFFRNAEVSSFIDIVFLVLWLAVLGFTCWAVFKGGLTLVNFIGSADKEFLGCFKRAFYLLLPVLILSLLTLSITPIRGLKYDTASMSEIAERLSLATFLTAMDEGTIGMFGVTLFVVITLVTSYYLMKILPDNPVMFFISIFVGVLVGVAVLMFLLPLEVKGFEIIKQQTGNFYVAHFVLFGIYSVVSAVCVWPMKKKKTIGEKLPA